MLIGKKAIEFKARTVFVDEVFDVSLSDYKGKYVVLFFYPADFTFVCPTELHAFQNKLKIFKQKNVEILACSVDSEFSHLAWLSTPKSMGGIKGIEYGIISDLGGEISKAYDILSDSKQAYRGLFIIDKEQIIRSIIINDMPIGRSIDEVLRVLESLMHYESSGYVCPANWDPSKKSIQANLDSVSQYLKNT